LFRKVRKKREKEGDKKENGLFLGGRENLEGQSTGVGIKTVSMVKECQMRGKVVCQIRRPWGKQRGGEKGFGIARQTIPLKLTFRAKYHPGTQGTRKQNHNPTTRWGKKRVRKIFSA